MYVVGVAAGELIIAAHAEYGIFQIVVAQRLYRLAEADGLLGGPDPVRIKAQGIIRKCGSQRPVGFQLVVRMKHAAFELVSGEAEAALELAGVFD